LVTSAIAASKQGRGILRRLLAVGWLAVGWLLACSAVFVLILISGFYRPPVLLVGLGALAKRARKAKKKNAA